MQSSQPPAASAPPAVLNGVLEHITYTNEDTGYTVARVATDRGGDPVTVVGPLLGAQVTADALDGGGEHGPVAAHLELAPVQRVVAPAALEM